MYKTFKQLGFKDGDTVVCTSTIDPSFYKVGDEFTLKTFNGLLMAGEYGEFSGQFGDWKLKEKNMTKFKVGDIVEVVKKYDDYNVGEVGTITRISEPVSNSIYYRINGDIWGAPASYFKKVVDSLYEDQWHLNDGKVEIPGDADKIEKDGSVVAFRKRKVKPFEFGEKLRIKKSLWPKDVVDPKYINPGLDYVDAVYICKYFDLSGVEGIKVYINNGEKSWECCFISLDKVERLT